MDRWKEGGRNRERFKEVEKGQAQITLAVTRASGRKGEKRREERRSKPTVDGWCSQENQRTNFVDF